MLGFCKLDVKPFELVVVQLYVAPTIELAVKFKVVPSHTGPMLAGTVGAVGTAFTVTVVDEAGLTQPEADVTVKLYVPDSAVVAFTIIGSSFVDVNPFGPVHE